MKVVSIGMHMEEMDQQNYNIKWGFAIGKRIPVCRQMDRRIQLC